MTDRLTAEQRSQNMARIKGKDTSSELAVRRLLHRMGYRFRLHRRDLPGTPDIVLPGRMTVIFVHGCFWHRHPECRFAYTPKSRVEFWSEKFRRNVERDSLAVKALTELGWTVIIVWECELRDLPTLTQRLKKEIKPSGKEIHESRDQ